MRVLRGVDPTPDTLRESLVGEIGLRPDGGETVERRLLDSFDWRVWNAGAVLEHDTTADTGGLVWRRRATAREPARIMGRQPSPAVPSRTTDLVDGPVRRLVEPVLQMRALLPRAVMRLERERFSLLDDEHKTVARAAIEHFTVTGHADEGDIDLGWRVAVTGVRGYDHALGRLIERLEHASGLAERHDVDRAAFEAAGVRPGDYSSKFGVAIAPESPTLQAFTGICSTLLDTIEVNEPGVRDDVDSEFLHDFRVAIRRTRAMLSQARGVIPDAPRTRYRDGFRWIFAISSDARDLDVHLLGFDELADQLPVEHRTDLEPLRCLLVDLRRNAHAELVAALDSVRYRELIDTWRAFLTAPVAGGVASVPVGQTARERIWKAYRSVVTHGRRIDDDTPAEAVHDLRKRAKKLRYLLEAYRSLFAARDTKRLLSELRQLQDNLGVFQDCEVQISSLRRYAELLEQRPGPTAPTVLAMGLLIDRLDRRQQQAREGFHERFVRFDRRKNRERFHLLFMPVVDEAS